MGATRRLSILVSREMPSFVKDHTTWQISFCQEGPTPPTHRPLQYIFTRKKPLQNSQMCETLFMYANSGYRHLGIMMQKHKIQTTNSCLSILLFLIEHGTYYEALYHQHHQSPSSSSSRLSSHHHHLLIMIRPVRLPLGFAPRMARLTLAFLPSMIGFGSLHARSAASLFDIITWNIFLSGWKNISLILSNVVCLCVCFN